MAINIVAKPDYKEMINFMSIIPDAKLLMMKWCTCSYSSKCLWPNDLHSIKTLQDLWIGVTNFHKPSYKMFKCGLYIAHHCETLKTHLIWNGKLSNTLIKIYFLVAVLCCLLDVSKAKHQATKPAVNITASGHNLKVISSRYCKSAYRYNDTRGNNWVY